MDKLKRKLDKIVENEGDISIAQLDATLELRDALAEVKDSIDLKVESGVSIEMEAEDLRDVLRDEQSTELLTDIRDRIASLNTEVDLSVVETYLEGILAKNVEMPVPVDTSRLEGIMKDVLEACRMTVLALQEEEKPIDFSQMIDAIKESSQQGFDTEDFFDRLDQSLSKKLDVRLMGGPSRLPMSSSVDSISTNVLAGTGTNGTRELTSADTWYAVPSTVPNVPYQLVVTLEVSAGTVRWGYSNSGTPSASNGNQAPSTLIVNLGGNQVIYYASSTAGDDVNWTTKIF